MSTDNAPRWGDSASEDEDDNIPRASSFVKFSQIESQHDSLDKKTASSYISHTSNNSNNNTSRSSYNATKKRHDKRGGKSKGGNSGSRIGSSGGKFNNKVPVDWKETAKSSQKYGSTEEVDGSAWMAQRVAKIKEREKENRKQQEEHRKKIEQENRQKRKNQFVALKESLLLRKQDEDDKEETQISPLARFEENDQNSPQRKGRPKLKLMPRTKPIPTVSTEMEQYVNDDKKTSQSQEADRKVDKILKRPKKKGEPKNTKKGALDNLPQDLKDEDADDVQSMVSMETRSTSGSTSRQNSIKKQSRKHRKATNKHKENKMSSHECRKGKNDGNDRKTEEKNADTHKFHVGKTKQVQLPHGEIEYHVSITNSSSKQNQREKSSNDTKKINSSNSRKGRKKSIDDTKSISGSKQKNDEKKNVKGKVVNKHRIQKERTKSQGSEGKSKNGKNNSSQKRYEVKGKTQENQAKLDDKSKVVKKNSQDKKSQKNTSQGNKNENLKSNDNKKSEHNSK